MCRFNACCCRLLTKRCNVPEPEQPNQSAARLLTFAEFPDFVPVDPFELAEAGFYYTGEADAVKCAFCKVIVRDWTRHDTPIVTHWRANYRCNFIKGWNVNNMPMVDDPIRGRNPILPNLDVVCGSMNRLSI